MKRPCTYQRIVLAQFVVLIAVILVGSIVPDHVWGREFSARVRYVIDGDTIVLQDGTRVRYRNINAPEIAHKGTPAQPYGREATLRNRELVQGKSVRLVVGSQPRDRFGRLLAYVFLPDGRMVNEILVGEGLAYFCRYGQVQEGFEKQILEAQRRAIERGINIWSLKPVRPERYYVGNSYSRRFHRPGCNYGKRTRKSNRVIFHDRIEAFQAGYCPCKKCMP